MRYRIPSAVTGVVVMLATLATASGCASRSGSSASAGSSGQHTASQSASADPSAPASSPSPPSMGGGGGGAAPNIPVVRLGTSFSPSTLQLGAGQKFMVIVGKSDKPSGSGISGDCSAAQAAQFSSSMLSLRCDGSSYLYTTLRAGSTVLSVTVKPNCASGTMCPQWIARASLHLNVSSS